MACLQPSTLMLHLACHSVGNLLMSCADGGGKDREDLADWGDSQPLRQLRPNRAGADKAESQPPSCTNASASLNTFSTRQATTTGHMIERESWPEARVWHRSGICSISLEDTYFYGAAKPFRTFFTVTVNDKPSTKDLGGNTTTYQTISYGCAIGIS
jgi:hypothetical protein